MSAAPQIPLADFSRNRQPTRIQPSSRAAACMLTCLLYALFALLLWQTASVRPDTQTYEATMILLPDTPHKKLMPLPPPFLAHLIKPHPETIAPPTFTIASAAPVAPAQLPASAAKTSPIEGGVPAGTGAKGAGTSADGSNGNGNALAGCFDAVWARAVTDHVRPFFHYPGVARAEHVTGVVMVDFVVLRDGRLDKLEIAKSSGDWALDNAAYNIVHKAQPMPAIPQRMHLTRIEVELPIEFGLTDSNLKPTAGDCG
jgi:protein TonB